MSEQELGGSAEPERREVEQPDGPRIYVSSLSDYNAGVLHGAWLDAADDLLGLQTGIGEMLAASPTTKRYGDIAEEWAIHDYEGFTRHVRLDEWEDLEQVGRLARGIQTYGEAFAAWWATDEPEADDEADLNTQFQDRFIGESTSMEEFGESSLEEMGFDVADLPGIPDVLRPYVSIDIEGWTRDLVLGGDVTTAEGGAGVYVFWSR